MDIPISTFVPNWYRKNYSLSIKLECIEYTLHVKWVNWYRPLDTLPPYNQLRVSVV